MTDALGEHHEFHDHLTSALQFPDVAAEMAEFPFDEFLRIAVGPVPVHPGGRGDDMRAPCPGHGFRDALVEWLVPVLLATGSGDCGRRFTGLEQRPIIRGAPGCRDPEIQLVALPRPGQCHLEDARPLHVIPDGPDRNRHAPVMDLHALPAKCLDPRTVRHAHRYPGILDQRAEDVVEFAEQHR